jgi:acetate---CoA ligase (ADP-forming)
MSDYPAAAHRLDPLLRPASIAVVGGSARVPSVGNVVVRQLAEGGYEGAVTIVNPRYDEVEGYPCVGSIGEVPRGAEHVVFAIGDDRIETEFAAAIRAGARAATIMSPLYLPGDRDPPLKDRIRAMANEAGVVLCGGNGMGFYHFRHNLRVCGFQTRPNHRPGGAVLLTHSGSLFTALVDSEERIDYGLAASSGQELNTTLADYMDFVLDQPWTRVIGLFMETARDPAGFEAALGRALALDIPVVALKVGRTEASARLAVSHSGAIAGDHAAYSALFERYGVSEVRSVDEMAAAMMLLPETGGLRAGGLAASLDSGGERGLLLDLASDNGVAFADLAPATVARLVAALDPGLEPVNPLDRWGTGRNYPQDFFDSFHALMDDPDVALGAVVLDRMVGGRINPDAIRIALETRTRTGKPVVIVSNHQGSGSDPAAVETTRAGVPVLDALPPFLAAARLALERRDRLSHPPAIVEHIDPAVVARWRARLALGSLDEAEGLSLLADFGIATPPFGIVEDTDAAIAAADRIGYPIALKTAMPGILHKSDVSGVRLGLADGPSAAAAYADLSARLGSRVLVAAMAKGPAVEMMLGIVRDPAFGPTVLVGTGGIHAEILRDVVVARPPFDSTFARRLIDRLRLRPMLDGVRGAPAADLDTLAAAIARFSLLAAELGEMIDTMDVNPLLAGPNSVVAVDALVIARSPDDQSPRAV